MRHNFTFAVEFIDFCFTAGFTLSSGEVWNLEIPICRRILLHQEGLLDVC